MTPTCSLRWPSSSFSPPRSPPRGHHRQRQLGCATGAYPGWGGYGSAKAALDQLTAVLATEQRSLRCYALDPGDMRTELHQLAFPGEDISDRPEPDASVPGHRAAAGRSRLPSGRYRASRLIPAVAS